MSKEIDNRTTAMSEVHRELPTPVKMHRKHTQRLRDDEEHYYLESLSCALAQASHDGFQMRPYGLLFSQVRVNDMHHLNFVRASRGDVFAR